MSKTTYNRITNVAIFCGIVAVLLYGRAGRYAWLVMGIAVLSGLVTATSYFVLNWHPASGERTGNEACRKDPRDLVDEIEVESPPRSVTTVADDRHALIRRSIAAHEAASLMQSIALRPKSYDARAVGQLLADLEMHRWDVSGTLRLHHPSATDLEVAVVLSGDTMRIVPTITGGRHGGPRLKEPASRPASRFG